MLRKRSLIVALTGLNLLLLAGLVIFSYTPQAAYAQRRGRAGDFLITTVKVHEDFDALAIINIQEGALHVFMPKTADKTVKMVPTHSRDLLRDFNRR